MIQKKSVKPFHAYGFIRLFFRAAKIGTIL